MTPTTYVILILSLIIEILAINAPQAWSSIVIIPKFDYSRFRLYFAVSYFSNNVSGNFCVGCSLPKQNRDDVTSCDRLKLHCCRSVRFT